MTREKKPSRPKFPESDLGLAVSTIDRAAARHLLEAFLGRSMRETLVVDCLKENNMAVTLLKSCGGFTYSRLLTRMYRGPNTYPGRPDMLCAILDPEFG